MPVPIKILLLSMFVLVFAFESLAAEDPHLTQLNQEERMTAEGIELLEKKAALMDKFIKDWKPYSSWSFIKKYVEKEEKELKVINQEKEVLMKKQKALMKEINAYEYDKGLMSTEERGCSDLAGKWLSKVTKTGCNESTWELTHKKGEANTYEAKESGCGNAKGDATWNEGTRQLHIKWDISEDCKGDYKWKLDSECKESVSGSLKFRSNREPCNGEFTSKVERK